ncbi:hypothetical protein CEXT_521631 [Caerostris extrusa]|uniref:Uncharacterized protein n=1 Tax=Caerostris extrusa TaxID=172846 RepID=A0AAV4SV94_CAEEX|nr:hypothetical protein CEXT_521631 [Caerostris extrusa]
MVHLERAKIEQKSSATFLLSEKLLMKMNGGLMGNFLTRHSNREKGKKRPKRRWKKKRKEKKNVSQISYICIGKSSQPFLITNETPTTCPVALKVTSRPGRQRSFTDVMNTDSLFTVTVLPCYGESGCLQAYTSNKAQMSLRWSFSNDSSLRRKDS